MTITDEGIRLALAAATSEQLQVGNAVPPVLAAAIVGNLVDAIEVAA